MPEPEYQDLTMDMSFLIEKIPTVKKVRRIKIRGYNINYSYGIYLLAFHSLVGKSRRLGQSCKDGIYSVHIDRHHANREP
jgi:hypothetical protein